MKPSDKYLKIVEWSEIDQCYVGTCPGLLYGGVHGSDEADTYKELCNVVEESIILYQEDKKTFPPETTGKKYSGKFLLRAGTDLHQALSIRALQAGESLNNFCIELLEGAIHQAKKSRGYQE